MAEKITRVLIVLANPLSESDQRANIVNNLCRTYAETCQANNLEVDILDLYSDEEFDPVHDLDEKDTKVIEYQIRVRKAQLVVFFHPVWWLTVPAVLKGFLDKVFVSGFAYRIQNKVPVGLLDDKEALVIGISDKPVWQLKYIYGGVLWNFWKKGILDYCGLKNRLFVFGEFRSVSSQTIDKWHEKVKSLADKINSRESLLDLF